MPTVQGSQATVSSLKVTPLGILMSLNEVIAIQESTQVLLCHK